MSEAIDDFLADHEDELVGVRRHLHAHPELGRAEYETTSFLANRLRAAGLAPRVLSGGAGLICDIGTGGPLVALRADLDALPIADDKDVAYRSTIDDACHACGHDVHTAVVLGAGLALQQESARLPGRVRLIFQPAEEITPGGALQVIDEGGLDGVQSIYALHCDPRLAVGKVAVRPGPITSAADQVEVTLHSPGGHTSRPHLTSDLVYGIGTLITGVPGVLSRRIDPRNSTVMVWGAVNAGVAANAIPQTGTLAGTSRTASRETWLTLEKLVHEIVSSLLTPLAVEYSVNYRRGVPPVVNEEVSTRILTHAIEALGPTALADTHQSGGGEDFSWYLEECPGRWPASACGRGRGPSWTCTSRPSISTSGRWQ